MSVKLEKFSVKQLYKLVANLTHERDELQRQHDELVIKSATVISELQGKVEITIAALAHMYKCNGEIQQKLDSEPAKERVWETTMMQVCGEDGPASVAAKFAELQLKVEALTAENCIQDFIISAVKELTRESSGVAGWHLNDDIASWDEVLPELSHSETKSTDAAIAEMKVQVWIEAKDFTKSMLATDSVDHIDFLFDGKVEQLRKESGQ